MSLLDNGPDTLLIWPEVESDNVDGRGNPGRKSADAPVIVQCRIQPVASDDVTDLGQVVSTVYQVITRDLPAGPWARCSWDGRDWDVVGEPKRSRGSSRTRHSQVLIRARKNEPVGES